MNRLNKNEPFVVFCRSGNRSAQAVGVLKRNGFQRVINGGSMRQVELVLETTKKI
jgi:rhodanese-related sulfurtransferase